jgi:hypothetical protein
MKVMSVNKVEDQYCGADYNQNQTDPVKMFDQGVAARTFSNGFFLSLESKDKSNTALSSWGIARGDDFSALQTGSAEITVVNSSSAESAWSRSCPGSEFFGFSLDGESVFGSDVSNFEPTNLDTLERVEDFNTFIGQDQLWANQESPNEEAGCCGVDQAHDGFLEFTCVNEGTDYQQFDKKDKTKVNPVGSWTINVAFGHVSQTTPSALKDLEDLDTKKGISANGN